MKELIRAIEIYIEDPSVNNLELLDEIFNNTINRYDVARLYTHEGFLANELDDLEIMIQNKDLNFEELSEILDALKEK